jgi:hypothetical protein
MDHCEITDLRRWDCSRPMRRRGQDRGRAPPRGGRTGLDHARPCGEPAGSRGSCGSVGGRGGCAPGFRGIVDCQRALLRRCKRTHRGRGRGPGRVETRHPRSARNDVPRRLALSESTQVCRATAARTAHSASSTQRRSASFRTGCCLRERPPPWPRFAAIPSVPTCLRQPPGRNDSRGRAGM